MRAALLSDFFKLHWHLLSEPEIQQRSRSMHDPANSYFYFVLTIL